MKKEERKKGKQRKGTKENDRKWKERGMEGEKRREKSEKIPLPTSFFFKTKQIQKIVHRNPQRPEKSLLKKFSALLAQRNLELGYHLC